MRDRGTSTSVHIVAGQALSALHRGKVNSEVNSNDVQDREKVNSTVLVDITDTYCPIIDGIAISGGKPSKERASKMSS